MWKQTLRKKRKKCGVCKVKATAWKFCTECAVETCADCARPEWLNALWPAEFQNESGPRLLCVECRESLRQHKQRKKGKKPAVSVVRAPPELASGRGGLTLQRRSSMAMPVLDTVKATASEDSRDTLKRRSSATGSGTALDTLGSGRQRSGSVAPMASARLVPTAPAPPAPVLMAAAAEAPAASAAETAESRKQIEGAMRTMETQRELLGDDVVDAALVPLADRLAAVVSWRCCVYRLARVHTGMY